MLKVMCSLAWRAQATFGAAWIPSKLNVVADFKSRHISAATSLQVTLSPQWAKELLPPDITHNLFCSGGYKGNAWTFRH